LHGLQFEKSAKINRSKQQFKIKNQDTFKGL
jgi:hypothetical protein